MAELNEQWMEKSRARPTCWPSRWTSCGPGLVNEEPEEGVLGDLVLCPTVARGQARRGRARRPDDELELLAVHGILHLLGYDHAEPASTRRCSACRRDCSPSGAGARRRPPPTAGRGPGR